MDPSPPTSSGPTSSGPTSSGPTPSGLAEAKAQLRSHYRALRREHVAALPQTMRALLFLRPPAPIVRLIPENALVGLYHAHPGEAPTQSYGRWFHENGRPVALPYFADRDSPMAFRVWANPFDTDELEAGPFGMLQPRAEAEPVTPTVLFVPLLAFTAAGSRLGQGGGHYDRWLDANSDALAIGLAWDCQLAQELPTEPHDRHLAAVVTPTRLYEGNS